MKVLIFQDANRNIFQIINIKMKDIIKFMSYENKNWILI